MRRTVAGGVQHAGRNLLCSIFATIGALSALLAMHPAWAQAVRQTSLPAGFVYLRDVAPSIEQDMRYAGYDNFVGRALPGYDAPECVLGVTPPRRSSRCRPTSRLRTLAQGYDCYRPTRAVRAMAQWALDGRDTGSTKRYYPKLQKQNLFALGYISNRSEHSAGTTVDLTVVEIGHPPVAAFDRNAGYGSCIGPAAQRTPDSARHGHRLRLLRCHEPYQERADHAGAAALARTAARRHGKRGFRNYHREWWHFSYGRSSAQYDFPIRPRGN